VKTKNVVKQNISRQGRTVYVSIIFVAEHVFMNGGGAIKRRRSRGRPGHRRTKSSQEVDLKEHKCL
jgi:hypothetical protein